MYKWDYGNLGYIKVNKRGEKTPTKQNSLMSSFYRLTLLLRKIHLGTLGHIIIQN